MARSATKPNQARLDPTIERCLAALAELLEDIRAQVYTGNPQLAQMVLLAEHLANAATLHPEQIMEVLDELREYENRHLQGHERYSRILRESRPDPSQLRWDW